MKHNHKITDTSTGAVCSCGFKCEGMMFPKQGHILVALHVERAVEKERER